MHCEKIVGTPAAHSGAAASLNPAAPTIASTAANSKPAPSPTERSAVMSKPVHSAGEAAAAANLKPAHSAAKEAAAASNTSNAKLVYSAMESAAAVPKPNHSTTGPATAHSEPAQSDNQVCGITMTLSILHASISYISLCEVDAMGKSLLRLDESVKMGPSWNMSTCAGVCGHEPAI
eukprot:5590756-Pyramimonas_sp.AAC.1